MQVPIAMTPSPSRLSRTPPRWNELKKPGPTCNPSE